MRGRVSNMSAQAAPKIAFPHTNDTPWYLCLLVALFDAIVIWIFIPLGVLLRFVGDVVAEFLAIQPVIINSLMVAIAAAILIMLVASVIVLTAAFRAGSKLRKLALMSSTGYASGHNLGNWCVDLCRLYRSFFAFDIWWDDKQLFDCRYGIADACLSCQISGCWLRRCYLVRRLPENL